MLGRIPARLRALFTVDKNAELPKLRNLLTEITLDKSLKELARLPILNWEKENVFRTLLKFRFIRGDFSRHKALALAITKKNEANRKIHSHDHVVEDDGNLNNILSFVQRSAIFLQVFSRFRLV